MKIDHVTVAGPDLVKLEARYRALGLSPVYGGAHSNGVTQMSIVSLADGSYVELISTIEPGRTDSPWWARAIAENAGPCAWALSVDDVASEAARVGALGVAVRGPVEMSRRLPDGRVAEWAIAFLGDGEPGSLLPFLIEDRTPREIRVPAAEAGAPSGVATAVVGVAELAPAVALFRSVYDLAEPATAHDEGLGARVARFEGAPVALAEPDGPGPLADRIASVGSGPCAFELETAAGPLRLTRSSARA